MGEDKVDGEDAVDWRACHPRGFRKKHAPDAVIKFVHTLTAKLKMETGMDARTLSTEIKMRVYVPGGSQLMHFVVSLNERVTSEIHREVAQQSVAVAYFADLGWNVFLDLDAQYRGEPVGARLSRSTVSLLFKPKMKVIDLIAPVFSSGVPRAGRSGTKTAFAARGGDLQRTGILSQPIALEQIGKLEQLVLPCFAIVFKKLAESGRHWDARFASSAFTRVRSAGDSRG